MLGAGPAGAAALRTQLAETADVGATLASVWASQALPGGDGPGLELLSLLGVPRAEVYKRAMRRMRAAALEAVAQADASRLDALLATAAELLSAPEVRPVGVAILERHPRLPQALLRRLAGAGPAIVAELPLRIKRQLWLLDPHAFRAVLVPLLAQYTTVDSVGAALDAPGAGASPRRRRERDEALQAVLEALGDEQELYAALLLLLRDRFGHTGDRRLCSLRADVAMALLERRSPLRDPCSAVARALDACVRQGRADGELLAAVQDAVRAVLDPSTAPKKPPEEALGLDRRLRDELSALWDQLAAADPVVHGHRVFALPVPPIPGYKSVVRRPMDLSTMRRKLEAGEYAAREALAADFKLMCDNCLKFNKSGTPYHAAGLAMAAAGRGILSSSSSSAPAPAVVRPAKRARRAMAPLPAGPAAGPLADVALLLGDPAVEPLLAAFTLGALQRQTAAAGLPVDSDALRSAVQLGQLASSEGADVVPEPDARVLRVAMPQLALLQLGREPTEPAALPRRLLGLHLASALAGSSDEDFERALALLRADEPEALRDRVVLRALVAALADSDAGARRVAVVDEWLLLRLAAEQEAAPTGAGASPLLEQLLRLLVLWGRNGKAPARDVSGYAAQALDALAPRGSAVALWDLPGFRRSRASLERLFRRFPALQAAQEMPALPSPSPSPPTGTPMLTPGGLTPSSP